MCVWALSLRNDSSFIRKKKGAMKDVLSTTFKCIQFTDQKAGLLLPFIWVFSPFEEPTYFKKRAFLSDNCLD